jgi:hypothetical protein
MTTASLLRRSSAMLFQVAALLAPPGKQQWIAAMRAEFDVVPPGIAQLRWAVGGVVTAFRANLDDRGGWFVLIALSVGIAASYIDIQSATRNVLRVSMAISALSIGVCGLSRATIAVPALVAGRALLIVCLGFPEPYSHDRMDVLFCLVPAVAGMCGGLAFRDLFLRLRR